MLFSRNQVRGGLCLYRDEDDDDQAVIFAQPNAITGMGTETFAMHSYQKSQSCTSAVFYNLILFTFTQM